jgi:AP-1-like factor
MNRESIKSRPELQNASDLEMDALCKELRTKAKCSETGPVIDQRDIDAALERRLSSMTGSPALTPN